MALGPFEGFRVVDLFAGSGALGIEALSRGAERADFVEQRGPALAVLERNISELGLLDRATVWALDLKLGMKPLRHVLQSADLVLLDPPYQLGLSQAALAILGGDGILSEGARVVVEHHAKENMPEHAGRLTTSRQRRYGETTVTTYICRAEP